MHSYPMGADVERAATMQWPSRAVHPGGIDEQPARGLSLINTTALAVLTVVTASMLLTGRSGQLALLFPAMATVAGVLLLRNEPGRFVALTLWLWILSPFIRRVVDAQNGWNSQNPILLSPLLVSALCAFDIVRYAPRLARIVTVPFVLALVALCAGVAVGMFESPPTLVLYAGLTWVAPILCGLYVAIHPEHHEQFERSIVLTILGGLLVVGVYGIAQFVAPQLWDRMWMTNSRMDSIGLPAPYKVRVFSTLNAPGPLAQFLSASLLLLLAQRARLTWPSIAWPAIALGLTVFLLSLARSAWVGFAVGLIALLLFASGRTRRSSIAIVCGGALGLLAVATAPLPTALQSMRETIETRITTMGDLSMDDSFRARRYLIPAVLADISDRPLGSGLGATLVGGARGSAASRLADQGLYLDNGILEILLVLGWFGGALFLSSTAAAVTMALRAARRNQQAFGYFGAVLALFTQLAGGTIFAGVGGAIFWLSLGMALTAPRSVEASGARQ